MKVFKKIVVVIITTTSLLGCDGNPYKNVEAPIESFYITPNPVALTPNKGAFLVNKTTVIHALENVQFEGKYLAKILGKPLSKDISVSDSKGNIHLDIDASLQGDEAYELVVSPSNISIKGKTSTGIFYGIQSLRQLVKTTKSGDVIIPCVDIKDNPTFPYRGMHLDVGRHVFDVEFVKRYIDLIAIHKMNKFHWHLTEDQGWRIEIKKYPKLTEIGSVRNGTVIGHAASSADRKNDETVHSGFYTQEEIKDVVEYASQRHITIIPEIELPGHASAAIAAYPFLSCFPNEPTVVMGDVMSKKSREEIVGGRKKIVQETWGVVDDVFVPSEETFKFLEDVLTEVIELFPSKYIHIGGDECPKHFWKRSKLAQALIKEHDLKDEHGLQSYFINRIEKFINSKGRSIIGWDEILEGGLAPNATVMSWRGESGGIAAAKQNHDVIMTPNGYCYFDHYQAKPTEEEPLAIGGYLPIEKVYSYSPIPKELPKEYHQHILGSQGNVWTEYMKTPAQVEYMVLPRMTALSEVLWTPQEDKNWDDFQNRLEKMKTIYDEHGYNYSKRSFKNKDK